MADFEADVEELDKLLPPLSMNPVSRHQRGDHRECEPPCPHWGFDLRPAPLFMDAWLDHPASSIK